MSKSEGLRIGHCLFLFLRITQQIHVEWGGKIAKQTQVGSRAVMLITQWDNFVKFWCWLELPFIIPSLHPGLWRYCPLSVDDGTVAGAVQGQGWPRLTPQRWCSQDAVQLLGWCSHRWGEGVDRTCRRADFDISAGCLWGWSRGAWTVCDSAVHPFFSLFSLWGLLGEQSFWWKAVVIRVNARVCVPALACARTKTLLPAWQDFVWVFQFSAHFLCVLKIQSCTL